MSESSALLRMEAILAAAGDGDSDGETPSSGIGQSPPTEQESRELYLANLTRVMSDG